MNREFVIIGAGPAGLSAAKEAAKYGTKVLLIDENNNPGGQLFTQTHKFFGSKEHRAGVRGFQIGYDLLNEINKLNVEILLNTTALGIYPNKKVLFVKGNNKLNSINADNILIATGAIEKPIKFPGWTLPGVMGAGAAQTMMNIYRVLPGKRAIMIGSGNVGLIVAYQLQQADCEVLGLLEVLPQITGYNVHAAKIRRAGIPILTSYTIKKAIGKDFVESVIIVEVDKNFKQIAGTELKIDCDLICIAAGLQPFNELCWALNLDIKYISYFGGFVPVHDENLETSLKGVFVAGDITGVEEASTAMDEGNLAGVVVAERLGYIKKNKSEELKKNIQERLSNLRIGSFGECRKKGKEILVAASKFKGMMTNER